MNKVIEISDTYCSLTKRQGSIVIKNNDRSLIVPIHEISTVILHPYNGDISFSALSALIEANVSILIPDQKHSPLSMIIPIQSTHDAGRKLHNQISLSQPRRKQIWSEIVRSKIISQGQHLNDIGKDGASLIQMASKIRSGDLDNKESQAARIYWTRLFGKEFRRDRDAEGFNSALNYGYMVLRALVSRNLCAKGLNPLLTMRHSAERNNFALSDDIMEIFRTLVDRVVYNYRITELTPANKRLLVGISNEKIKIGEQIFTLGSRMQFVIDDIYRTIADKKFDLDLEYSYHGCE